MVHLKFCAFIITLCLLLTTCVCDSINITNPCKFEDTLATCESIENFKTIQDAKNITKLIVKNIELKRIDKDDLKEFISVEEIDLSNSGLEEIDENSFKDLSKLHKINLAGNTKLKIPHNGAFITSNTLTCLNISNTIIEELGEALNNVPQLNILDLSGTNIKDFSPLDHLKHLTKLTITKSDATKDLCNILSIKEIIEKDENQTEIPLDCKIVTDNKTEVVTIAPKPEEASTIIEDAVTTETTTVPIKIEEPKIIKNTTKEVTNKTDVEPKQTEKSPEKEATTVATTKKIDNPIDSAEINTTTNGTIKKDMKEADKKEALKEEDDLKNIKKEDPKEDVTTEKTKKDDAKEIGEPKLIVVATSENTQYVEVKYETTEEPKKKNEEHEDTKPKENANKTEAMIATQKINNNKEANESPNVILESSDDILLPSTANTAQSNGVNIVLGIILCVMVVGAIGFGFKYWKNRRFGYTHANTQENDDEDKELQTIVAHRTDTE